MLDIKTKYLILIKMIRALIAFLTIASASAFSPVSSRVNSKRFFRNIIIFKKFASKICNNTKLKI